MKIKQANQNGSKRTKEPLHVQRLDSELAIANYNLSTSPRHPMLDDKIVHTIRNYGSLDKEPNEKSVSDMALFCAAPGKQILIKNVTNSA